MTYVRNHNRRVPAARAPSDKANAQRFSKPKLLLTTALLTVGLSMSSPEAWACDVNGTTVTCTSGGNPYSNGIPFTARTDDLTLNVNEDVQIQTSTAQGILVLNSDNNNNIDINIEEGAKITTSGTANLGIYVDNALSLDITSGADIQADHVGIESNDALGQVRIISSGDITTNFTTTYAFAHGIIADNSTGAVYIKSTGDITTNGGRSRGIFTTNSDSSVEIKSYGDITTKSATGSGDSSGIMARNTLGDVNIGVYGDITTEGPSNGVYVFNSNGNVGITISANITTGTDLAASPSTAGASGVSVFFADDSVDVDLLYGASITTNGAAAHGVHVFLTYGGASDEIGISAAGDIVTTGNTAHGILVDDVGSPVSISVSGTVTPTGSGSDGIRVHQAGDAVGINISGSVMGGTGSGAGLRIGTLSSLEERSLTVTGSLGALSDIAIVDNDDTGSTNDALTINNTGTITGTMSLNAGDDILNNHTGGTWILRNGSSSATADFGSGTDSVVNAGTLRLASTGTTAKTGALTNLESFSNSGTIDMSDDVVGDSLTISGTVTSDSGELRLDTTLDDGVTPQSDTLRLTTVETSGGATKIYVNNVGGQGGQTTGNGILLVDVATSSSSDAFTLGQEVIAGRYEYDLYFDATNYDWYLQSGMFDGVYEYPALVSGAMLAFQSDLDFLHKRLRASRAPVVDTHIEPVAWMAGDSRKGGFWSNISGGRQTVTSGEAYQQQITRLEAGLEGRFATGMGEFILGGFGGFGQNTQSFSGSTSEAASDALIAGAYASYGTHGFYGDVIAKYERHSAKFSGAATGDERAPFGIDLFGLSLEAGHSLGLGPLAIQPYARMAYAKALTGSFEDSSGVEVDLEDGESLYGQFGTRFAAPLGDAQLYVNAGVKHQFLGETEATVSGVTFTNDMPGTQGLIAAGLHAMGAEEQLLLSFETAYAKGADASELAASLNMELKF